MSHDADLAAIAHGAADQAPRDVGLVYVARRDALGQDKGPGPDVVGDDAFGKEAPAKTLTLPTAADADIGGRCPSPV